MRKLIGALLFLITCTALSGQSKFDVLPYWKMYQAKTPETYHLLMKEALHQLEVRNDKVAKITSAADWQAYREGLKSQLKKSLGPFPERTPLNARVTSTALSDGIVVENVLFESLPSYYVSASFFKKKDLDGKKLPVIVFCSGHSANGYRSESYQAIMLNYAKKGFAVFAFDPIGQGERIQYRKADGKAAMGPTHDHSYSGIGAFLLGYSPALHFIWDGIRAIDYLETRPDVDMKRVGIAGRSGGGTQSSYIAALDNRIVAAAPECYITTYEMLLKSKGPQDAEQVFINGIANGIDIPDLLHLRAPKPTLVVTTTNDIFSIQGVQDMKAELSQLYSKYGDGENFVVVEDNAGHASTKLNREACYRFFSKHLGNPCNPSDETVTPFTDEQLYASPQGDVFLLPGSKRLREVIASSGRQVDLSEAVTGQTLAKALNYEKRAITGRMSIFSGTILEKGYRVDQYLVKTSAGYHLPTLIFRNEQEGERKNKVALFLDESGKAADTTLIRGLLEKYSQVVCADVSGIGELKEYYNWQGDAHIQGVPLNLWFLGLLTNQTLVQYRLAEIDALSEFIEAKTGVSTFDGVARGTLTTDFIHWASLYPGKVDRLTLINAILSFRALVESPTYRPNYLLGTPGGMLQHYDLPDLYGQFPAGRLRLVNPVASNGEQLNKNNLRIDKKIPQAAIVFSTEVIEGI